MKRIILITGGAGNIGGKVAAHLRTLDRYELRLLDRLEGKGVIAADFGIYDKSWAGHFKGVDTVLHLAGDPHGNASWKSVERDNIGGTHNVLRAAREAGVRRVVYASTNQVMLGYRFAQGPVTTDIPPAPLNPYAISKYVGEQLGRGFAEETGGDFLALRIGYIVRGENPPGDHLKMGEWGQSMWLSNRDMCHAAVCAIEAPSFGYAVINLLSNNLGTRWDLEHARQTIGYVPLESSTPKLSPSTLEVDRVASTRQIRPGQWFDESFNLVTP